MSHPRPQLKRQHWQTLDGAWDFAFSGAIVPAEVYYDRTIQVPYSHETPRSGLHDKKAYGSVWYRRTVPVPARRREEQVFLHFGAVDWEAAVWINGELAGRHIGGYTPFSIDLTRFLGSQPESVWLEVHVLDDAKNMTQPRGKQDWQDDGHAIWYPRTTGIWQTVWTETVPTARLEYLDWISHLEQFALEMNASFSAAAVGKQVRVTGTVRGQTLWQDTFLLTSATLHRTFALPDAGTDDIRDDFSWSPEHPQLIDVTIELLGDAQVIDRIESYAALRSIALRDGQFWLNGRIYPLRLVLDQGYWPEGGLSATSEEMRADVELIKSLGFNGVRKHQKIENPLWLEWCDRLGLLVWEELPSAYVFESRQLLGLMQTWQEAILRDRSHPCIICWVPLNESWGLPDLQTRDDQRHLACALYHLTKSLDATRPSVGNDGWEQVVGDLLTIHDYDQNPAIIQERYTTRTGVLKTLETYRPNGRTLTLSEFNYTSQPVVLSEFGGIAFDTESSDGWGYSVVSDSATFLQRYEDLMKALHDSQILAGFCYTQLTDTYQEINGLATLERQPKADLQALAQATRGGPAEHPLGYNARWLAKEPQL